MFGLGLLLTGIGTVLGMADGPWHAFLWSKVVALACMVGAALIFWREQP